MENNIKNKEKFFALYWGQRVISYPKENGGLRIVEGHHCNEKTFLQLKPLSEISDEDAVEVMKIERYIDNFKLVRDSPDFKSMLKCFETNDIVGVDNLATIDYLRSKGYLIGFHSLTPDQIIEYGWAKIKKL